MKTNIELLYPLEYRQTACLRCCKPLLNHRRYTQEDIEDSHGATYLHPVNGYQAPLSPLVIGQWVSHDPMAWPEGERTLKQLLKEVS